MSHTETSSAPKPKAPANETLPRAGIVNRDAAAQRAVLARAGRRFRLRVEDQCRNPVRGGTGKGVSEAVAPHRPWAFSGKGEIPWGIDVADAAGDALDSCLASPWP